MIKAAKFVENTLRSGKEPARWLILTGDEEFLRAEAKAAAIKAVGGEADVFDFDWEGELSGDEGRLTLFDELRTASLFGEPKIVVIRKAAKFLKEQAKSMARFAAEEDPQAWVIFEDEAIVARKAKKLTKPVQALADAGAEIVDCGALYATPFGFGKPAWDSDLSRWTVARAKSKGYKLSMQDAYLVHSRETSGLRGVAAQLDKIIISLPTEQKEIRSDDIQKHVGEDAEASVFEIVDNFALGAFSETMSAVDRMFRLGIKNANGKRSLDATEITMRLLSMISTRMRELGRIFELRRDGHSFDDACGQVIGRGRKFLFPKIRAQLEARTPKELGECVVNLEQLDRSLKSGGGNSRDLLVLFLLKSLKARTPAHQGARRAYQ